MNGLGANFEAAGTKAAFSMREATGEVALLSEATGVKLPPRVRSFVAELPGAGTALEVAFSATAILVVPQPIVDLTEKAFDFINTMHRDPRQ